MEARKICPLLYCVLMPCFIIPGMIKDEGLVDAPTDYSVVFVNESFSLTWTQPFIPCEIDILYLVNTTVFNDSTCTILHANSNNTTEAYYSIQTIDNSSCTRYEICVQAVTAAGLGKPACVNTSRIGVPRRLKSNQYNARIEYKSDIITVTYTFKQDLCFGNRASSFDVKVWDRNGVLIFSNITADPNTNSDMKYTVPLTKNNEGYGISAEINLTNSAGSEASQLKHTYIGYVQNISISNNGSQTSISCDYWPYSNPNGCQIQYECHEDHPNLYQQNVKLNLQNDLNISNSSEKHLFDCLKLGCSHYNLYAFNIKSDGSIYYFPSDVRNNVPLCISPTASVITSASLTPSHIPTSSIAQRVQQASLQIVLASILLPMITQHIFP